MWRDPEAYKHPLKGCVEVEVTGRINGAYFCSTELHDMILNPAHPNLWNRIGEKLTLALQRSWIDLQKPKNKPGS